MSYITTDDLTARFGTGELVSLTDREQTGTMDEAVVTRAIADAEAIADSYIGRRYALPLFEAPAVLAGYVCDLARYRLYGDAPTDEVRRRHDDAVRWLGSVASGQVTLGLETTDTAPSPLPVARSATHAFGVDNTRGF